MKKVLMIILVVAFVLIFLAGGVVAKVNEDAFFDKLPIAYYGMEYNVFESFANIKGDNIFQTVLNSVDLILDPLRYLLDGISSTHFLLRAEPEQMVLQKYGGRVYVYSNSRAGIDKVRPTKVNSIEECTDWRKQYVLPDGYIYAARQVQEEVYVDVLQDVGYQEGKRLSSSGAIVVTNTHGSDTTNHIPCKSGDVIRIDNMAIPDTYSDGVYWYNLSAYDANKTHIKQVLLILNYAGHGDQVDAVSDGENIVQFTVKESFFGSNVAYITICAKDITAESKVYVNGELVTSWKWYNTNRIYDDTEYADSSGGFYDGWLVADYEKTSYLSFTTPAMPGYVYKYDLNQGRFTAVVLPSVSLD